MPDKNFKFGEFYLDVNSRNLLNHEKVIRLSPRAFDILLYLIKNQGQVVKKDDIIENVWTDSFVEENNLAVHISALRRVLNERDSGMKYIETVSGRGYCFLPAVKEVNSSVLNILSANIPPQDEIRSIAVLPFINKSPDSKIEYLAEGITDSLISSLSNIGQLKVISYSAVNQYKDNQSNLQEVGFLLGVESLLVGHIIEIDGELEIRVELVKVNDLSRIWGTEYNCRLEQLFKTKTEISVAIAEKLHVQLTKSETKQLTKQPTENSEAYQLYLKGRRLAETQSKQGLLKAIDYFNEALKLDPKFALAQADIGYAYIVLALSFYTPTAETVLKAKIAIQRALAINENLAEGHAMNGFLQLFEMNLEKSNQSFQYAIKLNKNSAFANSHYGFYLLAKGDFKLSLEHHYKSMELNPQINSIGALSSRLNLMEEFKKAIDNIIEAQELFSNQCILFWVLAFGYIHLGNIDLAISNIQCALNIDCSTENIALSAYIQAIAGNTIESRTIVEKLIINHSTQPFDWYDIAIIYGALGDKDLAFEYLEKAFESKFSHLFLLKVDPRCKSSRADPRFTSFLQRLGLA